MITALGPLFVVAITTATPPVVVPSTHGTCTKPDFDGDGKIDDVDTVPDSCGTGGCVYRIALANGRALGTIEGLCSFALEPRPGKLADIVTTWRLGAVDEAITRYRFNGHRYRAIKHRTVSTRAR